EHLQVAGFDEVDPRVLKEPRIVEREDDRIFDLDGRRGFDAARQILLRRRRIDVPRLAVKVLLDVRPFGDEVVLDADEAPLQPRIAIVGRARQLRVEPRLQHRNEAEEAGDGEDESAVHVSTNYLSTSFRSKSCARS